ncbi:MAG: glucose-1-phosphate cytidylyltransferase [Thermodesulfobacteriota bacterium]|nr:glucose-1-phosphate cytidylyltransferase [Thermodesulfobacteriota bacterium]
MDIVILCGGLGTRMREETEFRPKPMVTIGSRPILWHIMKIYAGFQFNRFILALGHKGEMIKNYFCHYELLNNDVTIELDHPERLHIHKNGNEVDWKVTLADTGEKAQKGARLKRVEKYVRGDDFMLTYGDGLADVDLEKLIGFHRGHGKIATVTGVSPSSRFGELKIDGDRVSSFHEKPLKAASGLINGGFFVFNKKIFNYLHPGDDCDLEYGPLEQLALEDELMVYKHHGFWACMDNIRDMEYLNKLWTENNAGWKTW